MLFLVHSKGTADKVVSNSLQGFASQFTLLPGYMLLEMFLDKTLVPQPLGLINY